MEANGVYRRHAKLGIGYMEYKTSRNMKLAHYHDTYEIYLQTDGVKYITVENECRRLEKGDLVLIEPYLLHITESRGNPKSCRYVMNIYMPLMKNILTEQELNVIIPRLKTCIVRLEGEEYDTVCRMLKNILTYHDRNDELSDKLTYSATLELLDFICTLDISPLAGSHGVSAAGEAMSSALKYIHTHYSESISLESISRLVNMSKSNFCLVFRKNMGETFISYLNRVRIAHAHRMICETKLPIKEIAARTGFESPSYMTALFKKVNGVTPGTLRRK